jgi:hypothetical protein
VRAGAPADVGAPQPERESGPQDDCSPPADVVVPLRGEPGAYGNGKLTLKTVATLYSGATDKDALQLRCDL